MSLLEVYKNLEKCDERRSDDFYPTPWEPVVGLLRAEEKYIGEKSGTIWEPACGEGHIVKVLNDYGYGNVLATDLIDRGFGQGGVDFLTCPLPANMPKRLISNSPFGVIAAGFIQRARDMEFEYVALLLKAQYFHADTRQPLYHSYKPSRVRPCAWRIDFTGGGANHTDCSWYIWDKNNPGTGVDGCDYCDPIIKPRDYLTQELF